MDRWGWALSTALVWGAASASAQTPPAGPASADGSGEVAGQGQMRTAQLSDEQARSHYRIGSALYAEGRFADAAAEFERAYVLSGRPALLYNAYVAYRDANDLEHAIVALDEYLRRMTDIEDRALLEQRLAAMRVTLESRMSQQSEIDAERARLEAERAALEQQAAAERARAEEAERRIAAQRSPLPFVVGGAGLAVLAGAGVSALITNSRIADAEAACPNQVCPRDGSVDLDTIQSDLRRPALAADVMLGVGSATLVTGLVMLVVQRSGGDEARVPLITTTVTDAGAAGAVTFRF